MLSSTSEMDYGLQALIIRATTGAPLAGLPCVMRSVSPQALLMDEPSNTRHAAFRWEHPMPVRTYSRLFKGEYDSINTAQPVSLKNTKVQ